MIFALLYERVMKRNFILFYNKNNVIPIKKNTTQMLVSTKIIKNGVQHNFVPAKMTFC